MRIALKDIKQIVPGFYWWEEEQAADPQDLLKTIVEIRPAGAYSGPRVSVSMARVLFFDRRAENMLTIQNTPGRGEARLTPVTAPF